MRFSRGVVFVTALLVALVSIAVLPTSEAWTPDIVIVGAGNTGSTLAYRLSTDPKVKVLLLSQGYIVDYRPDTPEFANWWTVTGTSPKYVANNPANTPLLSSESGPLGAATRQYSPGCYYPGGCSATNGQTIGINGLDYWQAVAAKVGDSRWNGTQLQQDRKLITKYSGGVASCYGTQGAIDMYAMATAEPTVQDIKRATSAITGVPLRTELSCGNTAGVGPTVRNMKVNISTNTYTRQNTFVELISPILSTRSNLRVEYGATALSLDTRNKRDGSLEVRCVSYLDHEYQVQSVCPKDEVLLAMGALLAAQRHRTVR